MEEQIHTETDDIFAEVPFYQGDEFMSIKPWKGAVKKPTIEPLKENPSLPDASFEFDFVHGYKSNNCYQNCLYNA